MAKETETTIRFKADIADLKKGIQDAKTQIRLANAEFKAAASGMDDWDKSAEGIQAKLKQLKTVLESQNKILKSYQDQLALVVKEQGEDSKGADELRIKIANQQAAINNTTKEIGKWEDALDHVGDELDDEANKTEELDKELESTTKGGLNAFTVALGNLASKVISGVIDKMKDMISNTIEVGKAFDSSMSQVGAISGATGDELTQLRDKAKEMGSTTKFTATEAADAFNYMAMAGWKTEDMLTGIEGVLNLAAASGADLATTSDIVTDALTAMGYSAGDAGKLADVMAAAASNANTNVEMMGATFQYAAPIVGALGMDMEDTALAIGLMANAGIKGEKAGTALRSILTRLSTDAGASSKQLGALGTLTDELGVQFYNADGTVRDLSDVLNECREAWSGLSAEQQTSYGKQIAGQEALSAWLAIMNAAPEDVDKLADAINNADGAAEKMAATMMDNLGGDMTLLSSKLEGVQIAIYEKFEPALRKGVEVLSKLLDVVDFVVKHSSEFTAAISAMAAGVASYVAFTTAIKVMKDGWTSLTVVTKLVAAAQAALNAVMALNPIGIVVAAVGALVAAFVVLWNKSEAFRDFWITLWDAIKMMVSDAIGAVKEFFEGAWEGVTELWNNAVAFFEEIWTAITGFFESAWTSITDVWGNLTKFFSDLWEEVKKIYSTIAKWINDNVFIPIKKFFEPIVRFFREAWNIIKELSIGTWNAIKAIWSVVSSWFKTNVIEPIKSFFKGLWELVVSTAREAFDTIIGVWKAISSWFKTNVIDPITKFFSDLWEGLKKGAEDAWNGIKDVWTKVSSWFDTTVIQPVAKFFTGMWDDLKRGAADAWEGIKSVFTVITDWFRDKFTEAWTAVKDVFSTGGKIFTGIKEGIESAFKTIVNGIIKGINTIIAVPFNAINNMLDKIRQVDIAGVKPFEKLITRFTVPEIPLLERGGILKKGQLGLLEGNGAEAVVPLDQNKRWIAATAKALKASLVDSGVISTKPSVVNYNFNQTNVSPKPLSRLEIYRQTNNQLAFARGI